MTMNQTPKAQVLVRQAASLLQQGFSQKAQQAINLAFQQGATSGVAWDIYAQACANLNQVQPAILGLKKAISLDGGRLDRALLLGQMLVRAGQWQDAANIYQQVIQQDDSQAKAWFGLGESLLGTKDVERALRCFSGALEREPDFPEARQRLAVCFLEKGEALKALRLLEKLISDFPDAVGPKVDYGEALRQANRYRQAQQEKSFKTTRLLGRWLGDGSLMCTCIPVNMILLNNFWMVWMRCIRKSLTGFCSVCVWITFMAAMQRPVSVCVFSCKASRELLMVGSSLWSSPKALLVMES
jgi:tetratricopeptide (TPR) repeat protein